MSQKKKTLTSEGKVLISLSKAMAQNLLTPILEPATVTAMGLQYTALRQSKGSPGDFWNE
jgi:hypothetical protein